MKNRINLFSKKKNTSIPTVVSDKINLYGTIFGVVVFVIFLAYTGLFLQVQSQKNTLETEKQELSQFILNNKDQIAKMNLYSHKSSQLRDFLKDDAEFLPYYNLLKDNLTADSTSEAGILDEMQIDKSKNTEFTVRYTNYEPAYSFLKSMEADTFLDNFIELKLVSFSVDAATLSDRRGYELKFKGRFKPIDGTAVHN